MSPAPKQITIPVVAEIRPRPQPGRMSRKAAARLAVAACLLLVVSAMFALLGPVSEFQLRIALVAACAGGGSACLATIGRR